MPANTFTTATAIGNREDLVDVIYNTAPTDTPLTSAIEKITATAVTHEWQRDVLAAPANNARSEGADTSYAVVPPTQRLTNTCQISSKPFSISGTQEAVKKGGRKSEIRYQTVKQGRELKKDMELAMIENPVTVTSGTRNLRGLRGWLVTGSSFGVGGANPNFTTNVAPTDGTLRTYTEVILRQAVLPVYLNGGNAKMLMVHPSIKQAVSATFTGVGTKFIKGESRVIEAAYDVYKSDFGDFDIVPNRVMSRTREAYLIDPDLWALAILNGRDMQDEELAKIGDARNFEIRTEYTLEAREERGNAVSRDIQ
jgi:hypothetical protein